MSAQPALPRPTDPDSDKGAVESDHRMDKQHENRNAQGALDKDGLPKDCKAIAEDVIGANEDQTQG